MSLIGKTKNSSELTILITKDMEKDIQKDTVNLMINKEKNKYRI